MWRTQGGFTLVEIAIVLVIIGLLLGGILKGQEMIVQARTKNVIADFSGVSAAYHGYMDRYRATPGDDPGSTRWGMTPDMTIAGNGILTGAYNSGTATDESRLWWDHLRRAGFVSGTGSTQPLNAVGGLLGVQTGDGGATPGPALANATASLPGFTGLVLCSANLPDKIAIAVDNQMDDGLLARGSVRGQLNAALNPAIPLTVDDTVNYVETGSSLYTLCRAF